MKISKEVYDALVKWRNKRTDVVTSISLDLFPDELDNWWLDHNISEKERNNRLIAIIRWVNGEDVFEVEKPKKWVVRSKGTDSEGSYLYVNLSNVSDIPDITTYFGLESATKFDTKEEAESWANSHQEVVEVEE